MGKHLNPLEKEFLIRQYLSNQRIKLADFCEANNVSEGAFRKWPKQYNESGLEGLAVKLQTMKFVSRALKARRSRLSLRPIE